MFDLMKAGKQIKRYRISADMTQMELAEKMGVSFQAVSSWERSETMPDITRLVELGELFQISVDELLDYQDEVKSLEKLMNPQEGEIKVQELVDLEGIIKPSDVKKYKIKFEKADDILYILPFLGKEKATEIVENHGELLTDASDLIAIAPFVNRQIMDKQVCEKSDKFTDVHELLCIVPFIGRNTANQVALQFSKTKLSIDQISNLAPFVDREIVDKLILSSEIRVSSLQDIYPVLPFISKEILQDVLV